MSEIRVFIQSAAIANTQVFPTFGETTDFDFSQAEDQIYFLSDFPTMKFSGADHQLILTAAGCAVITVIIEERCQLVWIERHRGTFTQYDEKRNDNECWGEVKPEVVDNYTCFLNAWQLEKVVFSASIATATQAIQGTYQAPTALCCQECDPEGLVPTTPICAIPAGYCWTGHNYDDGINPIECGNFTSHRYRTCFHRILGVGVGAVTPPTYGIGWTFVSGNNWFRCPTADELSFGLFLNGRLFNSVLTYLIGQSGCGLTVRSYFFNINATHDDPPVNSQYAYAVANLQHMTVHQKSDVKRPFDPAPAQSKVWKMTAKKLLDDLRTMFDVYWKIVGTDLIIEHISYFTTVGGLDVSDQDLVLEYGKVDTGAPKREEFYWVDRAAFFAAFLGRPIEYNCGNKGVEHQVNLFSTDIRWMRTTENPEEIADSNFALIANTYTDFRHYIIDFNTPLGWEALHQNLHRDYRYFLEGKMNGVATTFNTARKTRALEPFNITLCCDDVFSPENEIETSIGPVSPNKITVNYATGTNARQLTINANI